ncbi:acyl-CoA dehydrogenase [Marinihelvus fidelis]|uniref:Acyl-coenzyme A dehydrogenase n=1 Tax=Marinihelvus fidelis TaxID=2613842 RepID=A0A5N0T3P7_9GAMM|nr:acyl-CoA dehydrogenase [Marinihelvus fidelis]KAA9129573.1 acyl-CoA dehydrogenase [Marinihelvus fidelis]
MTWILLLALLGVSLACAFRGLSLRTWTIALGVTLLAFWLFTPVTLLTTVVIALVLGAPLAVLNHTPWRQQWLTAPFLAKYRKMLPDLSDTEVAAMEAGTVGWDGQLFSGAPDWNELLSTPWATLTDEEQAFLDGPVETLCAMIDDWEITHVEADIPERIWDYIKAERFFGMIIPREYGGLGFSAMAHRAVLQKVSTASAVVGATVAVPNSLGPGELILHYGTDKQKTHYLPRLARGEEIPCFGLTTPSAGSDATSIADYGIVCEREVDGKKVLGMRLTFDKRYITLAPVATVIGLAFRLYDPDGLLGDTEDLGISLALVPRDTEGMDIGRRHFPLNVPFQNGPIRGQDVFVPLDALIGGSAMAGKGWKMLVEALSVGRGITLPSSSTGGAKICALATGAYARIRRQFNLPIGRFEGVEEALARIAGKTYMISAMSRMTASAVDRGERPSVPSAIAKYHATEGSREIITDAMDIHGGKGIILGPRNYLGRGWQGSPIWITVEGANILTRNMMIFGQGAIRCHPYVLKEMQAARLDDDRQRLNEFDRLLWAHVGFSIRNAVRSVLLGLSFGRLAGAPERRDARLAGYYRRLSRYSSALAFCADLAMLTLGGKLKQKERLSARLGDVLSHLYMGSAVLYRFEAEGRPHADLPLVAWVMHHGAHEMQKALGGFADNFPNRWIAALVRLVVFPLGRWERAPGDRLSHRAAQLLLSPSEVRDRLTRGIYIPDSTDNPIGLMEHALPQVIAAEPIERKLQKAVKAGEVDGLQFADRLADAVEKGVLSETEARTLAQVQTMVAEIIAVDDFDPEDLRARPSTGANTEGERLAS